MNTPSPKKKKNFTFSQGYKEGIQRRKHARIPVEIKSTFTYMDAYNKYTDTCLITSLSTGGVGFETNGVLLKGDVITIIFPMEGFIIKEDAMITRTHGKEIGCKFIDPKKDNVKKIQEFIYKKIFQ
ncbi:MAG: PilZ domain-containing protein [Spirochaetes bacterium]|nr:PilZ domain-containing protein [Spirochaetota bacterium]